MAGRTLYWNPTGNANWNATNVWSLTDGGTRDQSTPDATDDCIFTNTNTYQCTISALATCRDITFTGGTGFTGTFTGGSSMNIYGSITLYSGMTFSYTGTMSFRATSGTKTITSATKTFDCPITFNGSGGTFQLADNFIKTGRGQLQRTAGTFDPNGKTFTITLTAQTMAILQEFTFYNLTVTGSAHTINYLQLGANQTITNTLTINGNSGINRISIESNTKGTARTLTTTGGSVAVTNADFQDITAVGDAGDWDLSAITGGSGNSGGNTNITFTTADDWYWHEGTGNTNNYAKWYTETNGGGTQMASTRVPLPQDTLHFDINSFDSGSRVITQNMPRIGSIDFTGAANTPTFTTSTNASVFGSLILISGMTLTNSTNQYNFE